MSRSQGWYGLAQLIHRNDVPPSPWDSVGIIREELFGIERLEQHAASLARAQTVTSRPPARPSLHARLRDNDAVLLAAYRAIAAAAGEGIAITPAAEWLIDNYHLVEDQIRQIHEDLPPRFYRQLPKLACGPLCGYPRVFGLAWACVAHSDSRLEPDVLRRFVRAYQMVQPLTIGELWAIAITLRILLVENLRREAASIVTSRAGRKAADDVADRLLGMNGCAADPQALLGHGDAAVLAPAFVVQLVKRLRDQDSRALPALQWLEDQLAAQKTSSEEVVRDEHHRQGASNVTVRNIITSMRRLSDIDWPDFFESVSLVDETLRAASDFADMDFATRNLYRTVIEEIARGAKCDELRVASAVVAALQPTPAEDPQWRRKRDPGYHLLAGGRRALERALGYRAPWTHWHRRGSAAVGPLGYIGAVVLTAVSILAVIVLALPAGAIGGWRMVCLTLLGLIPAVDVAVALVNRAVARTFGTRILPGLALREGVPAHLKTIVVVPTLLTTCESIAAQIEHLEVHFLASAHGHVYFALLSDWTDADTQSTSGDAALLDAARAGIAELNRIYGPAADGERFHLFHRSRTWSESEQRWMGWERKRGKLHELNRLLRGATDTHFLAVPAASIPADVRYVVTLDADTRLPRETLRRLVGKLAHPLNQPRFDSASGRVIEGYAVLQPRVTPSLPIGREGSLFRRVFSSMNGIDAYDAAVSDVYQDMFSAGSYAGKGIYDIDAFQAALAERVPDGTLLSHDLFEGTFARAGLASDIEVVEEFPARYDVAAVRSHRWARGDWQLLPWMLNCGKTARKSTGALPLIAWWKMLDNLRRTLSAPTATVALFAGWTLPLEGAVLWTSFILATIVLPTLLPVIAAVVPRRRGIVTRSHLRALRHDLWLALAQGALLLTFLAHQAGVMADAITRTLYRLTVSRRHLLEWTTSAQAELSSRLSIRGMYRHMLVSVIIALLALGEALWLGPEALAVALPFIVLWLAAPGIACRVSASPRVAGRVIVTPKDAHSLRLVARRTWRYFETFVTAKDHWLPPDNFQEDPLPVLAHRTSPTNIGLYLLCVVSARDFGWIATSEAIERLEATLATMAQLQRHRGHFYNWYDTQDLRPLDPCYVSSVDSGNLAAHLITVANACREWRGDSRAAATAVAGIEDALHLACAALGTLLAARTQIERPHELMEAMTVLGAVLRTEAASTVESRLGVIVAHAATLADCAHAFAAEHDDTTSCDVLFWTQATCNSVESWRREIEANESARMAHERKLAALEGAARDMAVAMKFDFLLDPERQLLSIGYLATEGVRDSSCYDLLASEARLASFFAIVKRDVEARHWFRLGRAVTAVGYGAALVSWSGSMFEYLMPSLVLRAPAGSLLEQTSRLIVRRQIAYGAALDVPWGVSESAYSARDLELTYQYSNFGVPGLGLKRGLSENLVVAPYATALAAMVDPHAAVRNFERLVSVGAQGRHGFYEALDYTRSRLPKGQDVVMVRAYMAHHQGMTIVAIANVLFDGEMRARFHAEPGVQAAELLLQERTPRDVSIAHPRAEEVMTAARNGGAQQPEVRRLHTPHHMTPQTHVLSNGRYAVMITAAGSGYSRWGELAVTRWREDATRDDLGSYIYLRDVRSGALWSAGHQPIGSEASHYQVTFTEDRAELVRTDGTIVTTLDVMVSPEDDAEVRRVSIANVGTEISDIDVTSFCELALATPAADAAHPAFSKLFVQTDYLPKLDALLATRRQRSPGEPRVWVAHLVVVEAGEVAPEHECETDRARFLGRGRDVHAPLAIVEGRRLSNTVGTVLDPVFALRRRVHIPPGTTARLAFWTVVADSRAGVLDLIDKHRDASAFERASTLAWTQAQVQLRHIGVTPAEANLFQRIAGHLIYADASLRPPSDTIERGNGTRAALWAQSISGDLPIVLLRVDQVEDASVVRQLLRAHEYWRLKQLAVDVVILNERGTSYVQDLQSSLETMVRMSQSRRQIDSGGAQGSIFILRADVISAQTRATLSAVARVVFVAQRGTLADQLERRTEPARLPAVPRWNAEPTPARTSVPEAGKLEFFNGLGGFDADGRDYVVRLEATQPTPAPWINVIANAGFGCQIAAEGGGYTWSVNSRENQLTQWSNDAVSDRPGEALYVRDADTGELWGPTIAPIGEASSHYAVCHGQGFSRFEHAAHDVALELTVFVPRADPVKICRLRLRNLSDRGRRLTVTAYVEWVLGTLRGASAPFIVTAIDAATGAMFAHNPWNTGFGTRVAFADLGGLQSTWTGDRREFLGRHGRLDQPAALLAAAALSGRVGAGFDPCCALQAPLELAALESVEVVFFLGQAESAEEARTLLVRYRSANLDAVLQDVIDYWDDTLGTVQVRTPDRSMDILLNRWLLYQTLVCRLWARSAFYQASGAYGFRDQIQDGMALTVARPNLTREHLLRAARRQFVEGDVQHWWLPSSGQGVRTRISDDRIWLAYAAAHYLAVTGDLALLDERVPFIEGAPLRANEHDAFSEPQIAEASAAFFEHCALALDASLALGAHGLPLIGTGDWNDGMNRVGEHGRGESVWLGWFLFTTLSSFAPLARARAQHERAARWLAHAAVLRESLERDGWDGAWYRRGYFDDGTPLGSATSEECRIDSIAQSWSVISGAADEVRATQAMAAVDAQLIRRDPGLALLFTPPFDHTVLEPGYIKGYPPGIRENGGQYTHAAAWSILAFARLGQGDRAAELFSLLNPINHTSSRTGMRRYKVEPYVVAADVYSVAPHAGRGGWTWYTGAAGWLYRAGLEGILGFRKEGESLVMSPCIPRDWREFEIDFKYRSSRYTIRVENPEGVSRGVVRLEIDDVLQPRGIARIPLLDDAASHRVLLTLG